MDTSISELIKPFDLSLFSSNKFYIIVNRMPETLFYVQSAAIPGITISPVQRATGMNFIFLPGETMEIDDITMTFIVDKNLKNYLEMHHWIREATVTSSPELRERFFGRIILFTLTNHFNPNIVMTFTQAFPYSLSAINLDLTADSSSAIIATVMFKFSKMVLNVEGEIISGDND